MCTSDFSPLGLDLAILLPPPPVRQYSRSVRSVWPGATKRNAFNQGRGNAPFVGGVMERPTVPDFGRVEDLLGPSLNNE
jgi:hypothetical protein